jgi:segregation and condensation protein B
MSLLSQIESILFVASKSLSVQELAKATSVSVEKIQDAIETLIMKYNHDDSGIKILVSGDLVQMATNGENGGVVERFVKDEVAGELTKAQLETLTVIAYRGPITRPELEQIRGVNCAIIIRNLLMRGLLEEQDNAEKLMSVYIISTQALSHLGIDSVEQLKDYEVLSKHEYLEQNSAHDE